MYFSKVFDIVQVVYEYLDRPGPRDISDQVFNKDVTVLTVWGVSEPGLLFWPGEKL